jgi:hypothetical protein
MDFEHSVNFQNTITTRTEDSESEGGSRIAEEVGHGTRHLA